jgi:hypothetical protein
MAKEYITLTLDEEIIKAAKAEADEKHLNLSTSINIILWERYGDKIKKKKG